MTATTNKVLFKLTGTIQGWPMVRYFHTRDGALENCERWNVSDSAIETVEVTPTSPWRLRHAAGFADAQE